MANRGGHKGKSRGQRETYHKFIKKQAYESTAPEFDYEAINNKSDEKADDLEAGTSTISRGSSPSQKIFQHFKENWIGYLISASIILAGYFLYNFSKDVGGLETNVDSINKTLDTHGKKLDGISEKIHDQALKTLENTKDIEQLENSLTELKTEKGK
jgi:hypothetical protein